MPLPAGNEDDVIRVHTTPEAASRELTQRLADTEAVKRLKYRYARCLDLKQWDEMRGLFAADAKSWYQTGRLSFTGADAIVKYLSGALPHGRTTVHQMHHPEIEIEYQDGGGAVARGVWHLEDYVHVPKEGVSIHGAGVYRDQYQRAAGGEWLITSIGYDRIYEEVTKHPPKGHKFTVESYRGTDSPSTFLWPRRSAPAYAAPRL